VCTCFFSTEQKSFSYLGADILESLIAFGLVLYLDGLTQGNTLLNWSCWLLYWFYQGNPPTFQRI